MRKLKLLFLLLVVVFAFIAGRQGYEVIKRQLMYPFVERILKDYCRNNLKAEFFVGRLSGNLVTGLQLENVLLQRFKGLPDNVSLTARNIKVSYSLVDIFKRKPKIEAAGLELYCGKIMLPLKFSQQDDIITVHFDKRYIYLNQIEHLSAGGLPLILKGLLEIKGIAVFERLRLKLFDFGFKSDNLEAIYGDVLKSRLILDAGVKGERGLPHILGVLRILELEYTGEIGIIDYQRWPIAKQLKQFFIDMSIDAKHARIKNKTLDLTFTANLRLKKESGKHPYLIGALKTLKGVYLAYQNKFKITKGNILFEGNHGKEALMDIEAFTRLRGYQIIVTSKGTLSGSRLELTSKPPLPRNDIVALLLFDKRSDDMNLSEKNALIGTSAVPVLLLNKLLLGRAEAKVSQMIGVDELHLNPVISNSTLEPQLPGVEVGKYMNGDKLYGSYKVQPPQNASVKSTQTITGEYSVVDNLKIRGQRSFQDSLKQPQEDRVDVEFTWKF